VTEQTPEKVFKEMNLSNVLVAILETLNKIEVPYEKFLNSGNEEKEMQVDFDLEKNIFTFKLKDKE